MIYINARFLTQPITGVQRFAIEISKQLKEILGDELQLVSPKNILDINLATELGVKIIGRKKGHVWEQIDLPNYLNKNNSPLLLNFCNTAPLFYKNKISTVHDIAFIKYPESYSFLFKLIYKNIIPRLLSVSKHVLTVSEFSKKEICDYYNIESNKISVVYNAVSKKIKNKEEKREKFILALSSLNLQKNFHGMLKAFEMVGCIETKLLIVGGNSKSFSNVNLIGRNKNVKFLGRITDDELVDLYNKAKLFVFPSFYEGFGIPPLEAQSCGCPCLVSNQASLPEVYGESVVYFNPYDISEMSSKIRLALNDEKLLEELKFKGLKNSKKYDWEVSAQKILKILEIGK
ncbi:glycosyltransferase family 4 protein [Lutibacter sp. B1]|nr:glycosyltransferase family 4 protein [Lutibacter sp. B1]